MTPSSRIDRLDEGRSAGLERLHGAEEVARALGITPRTVRRLAADGELTRVVLGHRTTRYRGADVAALIERSASEVPAPTRSDDEAPTTSEAPVITPGLRENSGRQARYGSSG